jgi:hypothetical protein
MPKNKKELTAKFLQQAEEYEEQALKATDLALRAIFSDLAEQCRQLGLQTSRGPYWLNGGHEDSAGRPGGDWAATAFGANKTNREGREPSQEAHCQNSSKPIVALGTPQASQPPSGR